MRTFGEIEVKGYDEMKLLFWIALKLRLRHKFWGAWYLRWHRKETEKWIDSVDLDTKDIKLMN